MRAGHRGRHWVRATPLACRYRAVFIAAGISTSTLFLITAIPSLGAAAAVFALKRRGHWTAPEPATAPGLTHLAAEPQEGYSQQRAFTRGDGADLAPVMQPRYYVRSGLGSGPVRSSVAASIRASHSWYAASLHCRAPVSCR